MKQFLMRYRGIVLLLLTMGVLGYWGIITWQQKALLSSLMQREIQRNNLVSADVLASPVSGNLKPQIINVKGEERILNLPESFKISIVSDQFESPSYLAQDEEGNVFISDREARTLSLIPSIDRSARVIVDSSLSGISGIVWHQGTLYVFANGNIYAYQDIRPDGSYLERSVLVDSLPKVNPSQKSALVVKDNRILVSVPANCKACRSKDSKRGVILSFALDGSDEKLYARGFYQIDTFASVGDQLYATDRGRLGISDMLPPTEINLIEEGRDYGWPVCYGAGLTDPKYPQESNFCTSKAKSAWMSLEAHVHPAGIKPAPKAFLPELADHLIVSYAGENNLTIPRGFKLVVVDPENSVQAPQNFITGWLSLDGSHWGSPTDMIFVSPSELWISDEYAGVIYRVSKQ